MEAKDIKHKITLYRFSDGTFGAKFEGLKCRAEVLPLLKQCDREARHRLSRGASLDEGDSKIESHSPRKKGV